MADAPPPTVGSTPTQPAPQDYKTPRRNPALRMLGLPALPRKLPSRNWLVFLSLTTALAAAVIYDRREKRRATLRWARAVAHLAAEPVPSARDAPRRLTVFLAAPPGDGLYLAREHFNEYVRPVLAASGLDWEFVQGRLQGDIRGAVAERIRRERRSDGEKGGAENKEGRETETTGAGVAATEQQRTEEERLQEIRARLGLAPYAGVKGDLVIGRHAWKEYVRGLHEGWLGPLALPAPPEMQQISPADGRGDDDKKEEVEEPAAKKPARPPPPVPYLAAGDYADAVPAPGLPAELGPSIPIPFPHVLGFSATLTRIYRFLHRRHLADAVGRDVAAACLASSRPWDHDEVQGALAHEEKDWIKTVWAAVPTKEGADEEAPKNSGGRPPETVLQEPIAADDRITGRMRRFEMRAEDEARAREIIIPEEEVEGWVKRTARRGWRWGARKWRGADEFKPPALGDLDGV